MNVISKKKKRKKKKTQRKKTKTKELLNRQCVPNSSLALHVFQVEVENLAHKK